MIVLDTDVLTIVIREVGIEYAFVLPRLQAAGTENVHATIISFEEHLRGWLARIARKRKVADQVFAYERLRSILSDYKNRQILDFDANAAAKFDELKKKRIRIGTMDLKIAAIALANSATLISRNLSDFRKVPNLAVEDRTK